MLAQLFPRSDNDDFLAPKDVAWRFARSIPRVLIDWNRGNKRLQTELEELLAAGTPEPILAGHRNLFDNTFFFQAEFPGLGNQLAEGWVYLDSSIEVRCNGEVDADFLQHAGQALASALDYRFELVSG